MNDNTVLAPKDKGIAHDDDFDCDYQPELQKIYKKYHDKNQKKLTEFGFEVPSRQSQKKITESFSKVEAQ